MSGRLIKVDFQKGYSIERHTMPSFDRPAQRPIETHDDFSDRLQRIRESLNRINRLMSELKQMSGDTATTKGAIDV